MAALFLVGLLVPGLATGQATSGPVEVGVIADPGPAADSLTRRVQAETEALFAGHRSVQTSVTEGAPPWTSAAATDAYQSARAAGPDAIVVVGPVSVAAICGVSGPKGSVPTIGVTTGSGLLVPDAARENCSVVGPIGWPSRTMRAFEDLTAVSSVAVAVDERMADHIAGAQARVQKRAEAAELRARLVSLSAETTDLDTVGSSDAVFIDHVGRPRNSKLGTLTDALAARGIPAFAQDPVVVTLDNSVPALRSGMTARVQFDLGGDEGLVVPAEAVGADPDGRFVYVVDRGAAPDSLAADGRVVRRTVTTGDLTPSGLVLTSGLQPGDQVVTAGLSMLRDGDPVRISRLLTDREGP